MKNIWKKNRSNKYVSFIIDFIKYELEEYEKKSDRDRMKEKFVEELFGEKYDRY